MSLPVANTSESSDLVLSIVLSIVYSLVLSRESLLSICNTSGSLLRIVYTVLITVRYCRILEPVRELSAETGQYHHCRGVLMRCNGG